MSKRKRCKPRDDYRDRLEEIERIDQRYGEESTGFAHRIDWVLALGAVNDLLVYAHGVKSTALIDLKDILLGVDRNHPRSHLLRVEAVPNRPKASPLVLSIKGQFAAVSVLKRWSGMTASAADKWVANQLWPVCQRPEPFVDALATRPITARTIKGWRERHGIGVSTSSAEDWMAAKYEEPKEPGARAFYGLIKAAVTRGLTPFDEAVRLARFFLMDEGDGWARDALLAA